METLARQECSIRNSQNPGCQGNQLFSAEAPSGQRSPGARGPQGSAALQWPEAPWALRTRELLVHSMCSLLLLGQTTLRPRNWEGFVGGYAISWRQRLDQNLGLLASSTSKPGVRLLLWNQTAKRGTHSLTCPTWPTCQMGPATLSIGLAAPL